MLVLHERVAVPPLIVIYICTLKWGKMVKMYFMPREKGARSLIQWHHICRARAARKHVVVEVTSRDYTYSEARL